MCAGMVKQNRTPASRVAGRHFFQWRWVISWLAFIGVILYESIEHRPFIGGRELEADFLRDSFVYGVIAFFAARYIIERLERLSQESKRSTLAYDHLRTLIAQLSEAQDSQEASIVYLQTIRANLPISAAQLLLYHPEDSSFCTGASWSQNGADLPVPSPRWNAQGCCLNKVSRPKNDFDLTPCICADVMRAQAWPYPYCYPLSGNDQLVGILYLYHDTGLELDAELQKLMRDMASEIVTALEHIQLLESLDRQKGSYASVQQRIAQDMHATLGHNLAYLRMKLDQISADYRVGDISTLDDLIQLRDAANESYQQMRDLLVALTPETTPNLRSIMTKYAQRIADRAGFRLEIGYTGLAKPLPPSVLQQVVLILREALGNIEKHAQARQVEINIDWYDDGLAISIADDGRGFDVDQPLSSDHLGLRFMQERASEIGGDLTLSSGVDSGTNISLWVPCQPETPGNRNGKSD